VAASWRGACEGARGACLWWAAHPARCLPPQVRNTMRDGSLIRDVELPQVRGLYSQCEWLRTPHTPAAQSAAALPAAAVLGAVLSPQQLAFRQQPCTACWSHGSTRKRSPLQQPRLDVHRLLDFNPPPPSSNLPPPPSPTCPPPCSLRLLPGGSRHPRPEGQRLLGVRPARPPADVALGGPERHHHRARVGVRWLDGLQQVRGAARRGAARRGAARPGPTRSSGVAARCAMVQDAASHGSRVARWGCRRAWVPALLPGCTPHAVAVHCRKYFWDQGFSDLPSDVNAPAPGGGSTAGGCWGMGARASPADQPGERATPARDSRRTIRGVACCRGARVGLAPQRPSSWSS
jgi:hypothetical protein